MAVEPRPSSTTERLLEASRDELAPHRSLEAVADASGRVVGAVSVAAALVSALGVVTATTLTDAGWGWAIPTVGLSAISTALAIWATVPSHDTVRPGDLEDVKRFFAAQIKRRGNMVRLASILFGLAVLLTPLPALAATFSKPNARLDVTAVREDGALQLSVRGDHLPNDAVVTVTAGTAGQVIVTADVDSRGQVTAQAKMSSAAVTGHVRVLATSGHAVVATRTLELPPP